MGTNTDRQREGERKPPLSKGDLSVTGPRESFELRKDNVGIPQHLSGKDPRPGRRGTLLGLLLALFPAPLLLGAPDPALRDPDYLRLVDAAFERMYNLQYEAAIATFSSLEARYPSHPGPPLHAAGALWLQELFERQELDLSRFIAPGYFNKASDRKMQDSQRKAFFEDIDRGRGFAEDILSREPGNEDARFFQGTAEALWAAFFYTVDRQTLDAFGHAKKAYQQHRSLIDQDPAYYDAYISVGLYEYIVDNLRWYLKWPAKMIGYRGSEERGIEYLEMARSKGRSVTEEASAMLMVIYFRERRYREALALASHLRRRFPQNFLFHLNQGQILDRMGRKQEAVETYSAVVALAAQGRPGYGRLPLDTFRYPLGKRLRELGRTEMALRTFTECVDDPRTPNRERALCHLDAGVIADQRGRRDEAAQHYEAVLALPQIEDSHQQARRYLSRPRRGQ